MTENNEIQQEIPEIRNAKWNNAEHTSFDTELNHPDLGWIPFSEAMLALKQRTLIY